MNDWSWWSPEEKQAAQRQLRSLAAAADIINSEVHGLYDWVNWKAFRQDVLDKYRNNEYCDIGNEHISFLDKPNDRNTSASAVRFHSANIPGVIVLQSNSYLGIPPTERSHWNKHEIPIILESERVQ